MIDAFVTGSSGFVGQHLMKKLKGFNVPIAHETLDVAFPTDPARTLFFLSTYGNMAHHHDNFETVKANVCDLIWTLEKFRGFSVYMSSSSVILPVQTPYSRTKRAAEEILLALPEVKSCIVRPFSITGVGEQKEHLIPTLIRSCMEGEEMPFDPDPVHDFVNVSDVCDGLIALADKQATGLFEFGTGIATENQTVLELVQDECRKKANVRITPSLRKYDNPHWRCLTYSTRDKTIWNPVKFVRQSISEMVEAYRREHV